jgi:hypothetical protein
MILKNCVENFSNDLVKFQYLQRLLIMIQINLSNINKKILVPFNKFNKWQARSLNSITFTSRKIGFYEEIENVQYSIRNVCCDT